jgi:hypothetical protein
VEHLPEALEVLTADPDAVQGYDISKFKQPQEKGGDNREE